MRSITVHNIINNLPVIKISHKGITAIKEIVKIAPQEAQWFHTVNAKVYDTAPNEIQLTLSDKLYIPTQNTSIAEVNTTSRMMIDFYKDLQEEYQDQKTVNQKLATMTCWCHSHHKMSPHPSSQDLHQFEQFIALAEEQNQKTWQIMLIFNKKDEFYSRVYNPFTGVIHEGVSIVVAHEYDFTYIHQSAKTKFKKPALLPTKKTWWSNKQKISKQAQTPSKELIFNENPQGGMYENELIYDFLETKSINTNIVNEILASAFPWHDPDSDYKDDITLKIKLDQAATKSLLESLFLYLDDREVIFFTYLLSSQAQKILPIFTEKAFDKHFNTSNWNQIEAAVTDEFITNLTNSTVTLQSIINAMETTLDLADISTKKDCKEYLKANDYI